MPSSKTVDLYEILQVSPRAESDVIAAAYRALARRHHPDAGGNAQSMIAINHAWEVLGNPRKRTAYDRVRRAEEAARNAPQASAQPSWAAPAPRAATANPPPPPRHAPATKSSAPPHAAAAVDGSVLDFGRYAGWSIEALVKEDPDYLLWLARTPIGRRFRREIDERLAAVEAPASRGPSRRPLFGHRRFGFAGAR